MDTSTWLTCAQASDLLRVSQNTIRTWVRRDLLRPARAGRPQPGGATREVDVFNPEDLAVFARRRSMTPVSSAGEVAARAFELFDVGTSQREIVVQLRETPQRVAELHEQWLELGGADLVVGGAARVELERYVGPFVDIADLVVRVAEVTGARLEVSVDEGSPLARASDAAVERAIVGMLDAAEGRQAP